MQNKKITLKTIKDSKLLTFVYQVGTCMGHDIGIVREISKECFVVLWDEIEQTRLSVKQIKVGTDINFGMNIVGIFDNQAEANNLMSFIDSKLNMMKLRNNEINFISSVDELFEIINKEV